jgi:hypothetical protein
MSDELSELVEGDVCWWLNDGNIYIVKVSSVNVVLAAWDR